jgi:predicted ATPase
VDAVAQLVEHLLTDCPLLAVLVTSRTRLVVPFEQTYLVTGLSLPDEDGAIDGDAVRLFLARTDPAVVTTPDGVARDQVRRICMALRGVALAVELAAARLPSLGLDGLETSMADQLGTLTGGDRLSPRHLSLTDTLQWS